MRALGFEVKKVDVLKILKDYDREGNGKITFEDFKEVGELAELSLQSHGIFHILLNLTFSDPITIPSPCLASLNRWLLASSDIFLMLRLALIALHSKHNSPLPGFVRSTIFRCPCCQRKTVVTILHQ